MESLTRVELVLYASITKRGKHFYWSLNSRADSNLSVHVILCLLTVPVNDFRFVKIKNQSFVEQS